MGTEWSQGIGADIQGARKTFRRGGAVITNQFLFAGESQAVDQPIKDAPLFFDLGEHTRHLLWILNIQGQEQAGLQRSGELTHLGFKTAFVVGEVGDAKVSTCRFELLSDAPGNRAVVGNAGNQDFFAGEIEQHQNEPEQG